MDHLARIQKAIDFIEDHLKDELPTEAIARVAGFSMWHFQRVFSASVGDTLKEYVRKRRLSSALIELGTSERRILDIALDYQFESQESFTRAFKAEFGRNPGECRKQGIQSILFLNKPRITMAYLDHLYGGMTMQPKFVTIEEKKLVGLGTNFISVRSPDKNNMVILPRLWQEYFKRSHEIRNRAGQANYGLCEVLPESARKSHPDECFYMACAEVTDFSQVPEGMIKKIVPAGRYAIFTHKGRIESIEHTLSYIYGSWLPKSGEELRDAPDLELYDQRFCHGSETSELDIYIPVE